MLITAHNCHTNCRTDTVPVSQRAAGAAMLASLVLLSTATPSSAAASPPIEILQGPARVVDGDTLYIGSEKVRLYAVDAPEKTQPCTDTEGKQYLCGQVSLQALRDRVGDQTVRCEVKTKDQYGRNVAACSVVSGSQQEDINGWLVANGYAVAYEQYGKDYVQLAEEAQAGHKGIWQGEFTEPALWRKQQRAASLGLQLANTITATQSAGSTTVAQPAQPVQQVSANAAKAATQTAVAAAQQAAESVSQSMVGPGTPAISGASKCNGPLIKGNINSKGQKLYHTPNSRAYTRVEINERKGEKFFCSEQEALAAGWQPAK
eukprot:GHRR01006131.1.p1 GENE.GHRR01006131.1~~GHRR01006131.1.p1  ORF type:complete len:319 (+),score=111.51 GHRR01006131.1:262-1218(+)